MHQVSTTSTWELMRANKPDKSSKFYKKYNRERNQLAHVISYINNNCIIRCNVQLVILYQIILPRSHRVEVAVCGDPP